MSGPGTEARLDHRVDQMTEYNEYRLRIPDVIFSTSRHSEDHARMRFEHETGMRADPDKPPPEIAKTIRDHVGKELDRVLGPDPRLERQRLDMNAQREHFMREAMMSPPAFKTPEPKSEVARVAQDVEVFIRAA